MTSRRQLCRSKIFRFPKMTILWACVISINALQFVEPAHAAKSSYAVVIDDALPLYKRVITGVGIESRADFVEYSLDGEVNNGPDVMKRVLATNPKVIIAVGPKSANAAKKQAIKLPIIYCLVPRLENYDLEQPNVVGIRLEFPYEGQLQTLKAILPKVKRVGVLYNPMHSKSTVEHAKRAAGKLGISLVTAEIFQPGEALKALDDLKNKIDALWMVSDPTALNLRVWDVSQQFALEQQIPFFSLDDGFVARGALLSYALDYVWVGRQAARLANRILFEGLSLKDLRVLEPEGLNLAVNMTTATQIGVAAELSVNLLNYAATNQFGVQVFR